MIEIRTWNLEIIKNLDRYSKSQTMLIQHAGNDEFFLPSDTYFYWDELYGQKYMRTYPNKGHGGVGFDLAESDDIDRPEIGNIVWQALNGIFNEVLEPKFSQKSLGYHPWTWDLFHEENSSGITFKSNIEPTSIKVRNYLFFTTETLRSRFEKKGP